MLKRTRTEWKKIVAIAIVLSAVTDSPVRAEDCPPPAFGAVPHLPGALDTVRAANLILISYRILQNVPNVHDSAARSKRPLKYNPSGDKLLSLDFNQINGKYVLRLSGHPSNLGGGEPVEIAGWKEPISAAYAGEFRYGSALRVQTMIQNWTRLQSHSELQWVPYQWVILPGIRAGGALKTDLRLEEQTSRGDSHFFSQEAGLRVKLPRGFSILVTAGPQWSQELDTGKSHTGVSTTLQVEAVPAH